MQQGIHSSCCRNANNFVLTGKAAPGRAIPLDQLIEIWWKKVAIPVQKCQLARNCVAPGYCRSGAARPNNPRSDIEIMPMTPDELLGFLEKNGIETTTIRHPALHTVAESQQLRGEIDGGHTKNLFLKDKKGSYFLVTALEDAEIDLKKIHTLIGASGRVSFGKPEQLMELLGVVPGSVTVFGAINDTGHNVSIVLDSDLMEHEVINGHPLTNEATTTIRREDLLRFLKLTGHEPAILKVSA
jgi:Ala-tRNA(Pro) deacylase